MMNRDADATRQAKQGLTEADRGKIGSVPKIEQAEKDNPEAAEAAEQVKVRRAAGARARTLAGKPLPDDP